MPRRTRSFTEGIYHVGAHGSDDRLLFLNDEDRNDFLERLASTCGAGARDRGRRGAAALSGKVAEGKLTEQSCE